MESLTGKPGFPTVDEFDTLRSNLIKEFAEVGNQWQYHLAFGRRPE